MTAFLIAHRLDITDSETLKAYRNGVEETIAAYGGKVVVRSDGFEVLEGDWHPGRKNDDADPERVTVIQFPDMAALKRWYNSEEYAGLKAVRLKSSRSDVVAVEGSAARP